MMKIEEIWIYPIKSCAGYRVAESELQTTGLKHDRNWMLVDESGRFVSQRKLPSMARITAVATEDHLRIRFRHPSEKSLSETVHRAESWHGHWLEADLDPGSQNPASVSVWSDTVTAHCYPDDINSELSSWLGQTVRLVKMASSTARMRNKKRTQARLQFHLRTAIPFCSLIAPVIVNSWKNKTSLLRCSVFEQT